MKAKSTLAVLFLMVAGVQTAMAQKMVVRMTDNTVTEFDVTQVVDVTFEEGGVSHGTTDGHEWVDLGLPRGTLWATCNVGANSSEEYGDYFAWGETEPKDEYNWATYKWMNAGQSDWKQINKYTFADNQRGVCWYDSNRNFIGDGLTELLPEDDAATVNWGSGWQMPSRAQQDELKANCTYTWTQLNGVNGILVTGPNGNTIFMPAAGRRYDTSLNNAGSNGYCWSRSLSTYYSVDGYSQGFGSNYWNWSNDNRSYGQCIRPVRK